MDIEALQRRLAVARGDLPADLLLKNAKLINTLSYEIEEESVAVFEGFVVGIGDYEAREVVDLKGRYLSPSLIDGHIHIESTLLSPPEFARTVVPLGTGAVFCDPHEIANVCGTRGIQYMLDASEDVPMDIFVMLPSCVPATHMETSGANLDHHALAPFLSHPRVIGIAEVMNFPGVVLGMEAVLKKIELGNGRPVDGHAPGVRGKWINAYVLAGIHSDHESREFEEAQEKLRRGMYVFIREGSTAKNMDALLPLVRKENCQRFAFVSDDRHADELRSEGHMNATIRKTVEKGLDPIIAVAMASTHTAAMFGVKNIGAIAPGRRANFVLFEDLKSFNPLKVWHNGKVVAEDGHLTVSIKDFPTTGVTDTVHVGKITATDLAVRADAARVNIIDIIPDQIVTGRSVATLPIVDGNWQMDLSQDILKMVVVERHGHGGSIGKGFVRGFGLKSGALASTVAHDSHNIICSGVSDSDMLAAIRALSECGGGWVAVENGKTLALLKLPIAGLMSDQNAASVEHDVDELHRAARKLGCKLSAPFMALSFLALPVIPSLKLTDQGLVDVNKFELIGLGVN